MLSIIVPVYNMEDYLDRCVSSLLNQGLDEESYEIILVNDGSTDNSLQLCLSYSDRYTQVRVVSQENCGLGPARNTGINHACGQWLCFVDADDYLENNGLAQIVSYCKKEPDLIRYWCKIVHPSTKPDNVMCENVAYFKGLGFDYIRQYGLETFCWNYLYRKEFLQENNLFFSKILGEDFEFMFRVFMNNPVIISLSIRAYCYVIRESSISTNKDKTFNKRKVEDLLSTLISMRKEVERFRYKDEKIFNNCVSSIAGKIPTLFTVMFAAEYSLSEFKSKLQKCREADLLPVKTSHESLKVCFANMAINAINACYPFYLPATWLYKYIFLPYIKPRINRNR